jgi:hypothetical protein
MKKIITLFGVLLLAGLASAQNPTPAGEAKQPAPAAAQAVYGTKALYPLNTCVVTDEELEGEGTTVEAGGRTFKLCCKKCTAKLEKDVATYAKKVDAAIVAAQLPKYPLNTCPVSGEKLGGMGEPVRIVVDGTLVQLCCAKCTKQATSESAAMAMKVRDAAFAQQMAKYPLKTCVVTGKELGADAVNTMFGTTLVRTCCPKCVAAIEKEPAKFIAKLAPAAGKDAPGKEVKKGDGGKDGEDCCAEHGAAGCGNCVPAAGVKAEAKTGCCQEAKAGEAKTGCCQEAKAGEKPTGAKVDCCEGEKATGKPAEAKTEKPAPAKEPAKQAEPQKKVG